MGRPRNWIQARLAELAKQFSPPPPRYAEIEIVITTLDPVYMTEARLTRLRSLFPGRDDSEIANEMINALFEQVGFQD